MNANKQPIIILCAALFLGGSVLADDDASGLVNSIAQATPEIQLDPETLEDQWGNWVNTKSWGAGNYVGGVQDFPARGIVVSYGSVYIKTRPGQRGWIESRMIAYAQADLQARSRLVEFWAQRLAAGRGLEVIQNQEYRDGVVQDMQDISEIRLTLERWGKKGVRLTDAVLDKLISLADADYDPETLNAMLPEQQKVVLEEMFKQSVSRVAAQALAGVANIYTAENAMGSETQVLVGIIWSPNLDQVAWGIRNDSNNTAKVASGMNINRWVSDLNGKLLGMWGTRIMVDEQGQYNVLAFAQAAPAPSSPNRQNAAIHRAKEIAENRARAMIVNFVAEKVVLKSKQGVDQIFQKRADLSDGTAITTSLQKVVQGKRQTLKISGLRTLKKWSMTHPETGQKVAGAIVVWSPSSRNMAKRMAHAMQGPKQPMPSRTLPSATQQPRKSRIIESVNIDTSAY